MLENEHPALLLLLDAQLDGELEVVQCCTDFLLDILSVLFGVIEQLLKTAERTTHRAEYDHEGPILIDLLLGFLSLGLDRQIPGFPVVRVGLSQI